MSSAASYFNDVAADSRHRGVKSCAEKMYRARDNERTLRWARELREALKDAGILKDHAAVIDGEIKRLDALEKPRLEQAAKAAAAADKERIARLKKAEEERQKAKKKAAKA